MADFIDRRETMNAIGLTTDAIKINPKYVDAQGNELVAVVRCKDCWIFHQDETWNPKAGLCGWFDKPVGVNDFCSNGERREDAKTN